MSINIKKLSSRCVFELVQRAANFFGKQYVITVIQIYSVECYPGSEGLLINQPYLKQGLYTPYVKKEEQLPYTLKSRENTFILM